MKVWEALGNGFYISFNALWFQWVWTTGITISVPYWLLCMRESCEAGLQEWAQSCKWGEKLSKNGLRGTTDFNSKSKKSCTMHLSQEQCRLETNLARIQLCKKRSWGILKGSKLNDSAVLLSCKGSQVHGGLRQWETAIGCGKWLFSPLLSAREPTSGIQYPAFSSVANEKPVRSAEDHLTGQEQVQRDTSTCKARLKVIKWLGLFNTENSRVRGESVAVFLR